MDIWSYIFIWTKYMKVSIYYMYYRIDVIDNFCILLIFFDWSSILSTNSTQVCRNINRIKICMEAGRTVVLLNLENLYESLYDALNQVRTGMGDSLPGGLTCLKSKQCRRHYFNVYFSCKQGLDDCFSAT